MSLDAMRSLLGALRRAAGHQRIYGPDHDLTVAAVEEFATASDRLRGAADAVLLTVVDDTLYVDRSPQAAVSIEFNTLIRELERLGIDSILLQGPARHPDVQALTRLLAGTGDGPTSGSIVLNDVSWTRTDLEDSPTQGLRQAYSSSLQSLRSVGDSVRTGTGLDLTHATSAVSSLLEHVIAQPEAAFLLATVKGHHEYTFYHSVNTSILAIGLGRSVGLREEDLMILGLGALLHDIGKIGVSATILQHPGRLGPEAWREIKRHPVIGAEMILSAAAREHEDAAVIAFEHHSGYDGHGYPTVPEGHGHHHGRRASKDLHLFSRLTAVVDTYDAITTRRSYRRAERPSFALHALLAGAGRSHDPDAVQAFIGMVGVYPPGSRLLLDDGRTVVVVRSTDAAALRPVVAVVSDPDGTSREEPELIELDTSRIADQVSVDGANEDASSLVELLTVS